MKNIISLITVLAITATQLTFSQSDSLQRQINNQVWKPFMEAVNSGNAEGFRAVHSKDVTRIMQDNNTILNYDQYFQRRPDSANATMAKWKNKLELRFIRRMGGGDKAFDVGYYKLISTNTTTNETRTSYGKFHVLLRKENNVWKILMDTDAHENTTEAIFMSAKPIE